MFRISSNDDGTSTVTHFTRSEVTGQSARSISDQEYDFLDFLGAAQSLKIDFLSDYMAASIRFGRRRWYR